MKTVVVGYSRKKIGIALSALVLAATAPIAAVVLLPSIFDLSVNGLFDVLTAIGLLGLFSLLSCALLFLVFKKFKASKEALIFCGDGIYSSVSGIGEKFIPWSDIDKAYEHGASSHQSAMIMVEGKLDDAGTANASWMNKKAIMVIWPMALDKSSGDVVDLLNDYVADYNQQLALEKYPPNQLSGDSQLVA